MITRGLNRVTSIPLQILNGRLFTQLAPPSLAARQYLRRTKLRQLFVDKYKRLQEVGQGGPGLAEVLYIYTLIDPIKGRAAATAKSGSDSAALDSSFTASTDEVEEEGDLLPTMPPPPPPASRSGSIEMA